MTFFFPDTPDVPLPDGHRFPAGKYRQVRAQVEAEGLLARCGLAPSPPATDAALYLAHAPAYVAAVDAGTLTPDQVRRIGLPWSETLARRARITVGGTQAAARVALRNGVSGQLAGGTHHAHRSFGSGFCVFNDLAVTALNLRADGHARRIAILDTDVHQGDGNASILAHEPEVFVASIHGEKNFPFRKCPSDLDIGLPDGADDRAYLAAVDCALDAIAIFQPDVVLYLSGADALAEDSLGRVDVTHTGLIARDTRVFAWCHDARVPVVLVLGGGYCRPLAPTVTAYVNTIRVVSRIYELGMQQADATYRVNPATDS